MIDQGYITQEQYNQVINDDIYSEIQAAQVLNEETDNTVYSYFEDELIDQVINDLMNIKGYTRTQAQNLVYSGGLSIYTTQDARIQAIVDEEINNPENYKAAYLSADYRLSIRHADGSMSSIQKILMKNMLIQPIIRITYSMRWIMHSLFRIRMEKK